MGKQCTTRLDQPQNHITEPIWHAQDLQPQMQFAGRLDLSMREEILKISKSLTIATCNLVEACWQLVRCCPISRLPILLWAASVRSSGSLCTELWGNAQCAHQGCGLMAQTLPYCSYKRDGFVKPIRFTCLSGFCKLGSMLSLAVRMPKTPRPLPKKRWLLP